MLLDDSNYPAWKSYIKNRLEDEGLWSIAIGTEAIPSQHDAAMMEEFKKKSRLAFYLLIKSMDDSVVFSVSALEFENNPSELWKALQSKYQPNDLHSKFEAFKKFKAVRFNKNDPDQFIDLIRDCFAELDQAGFNLDESTWMVLFLSQLPAHVADSILAKPEHSSTSQPVPITSCEYLFEKLRSLPVQQLNPSNPHQKLQHVHSNDHTHSATLPLSCQKCNRKSHDVDHCWVAHPELSPFNNTKTKFGPPPTGPSSASSNNGNLNSNNNSDKFNKRGVNGLAPHQKYKNLNDQDQSNPESNNDWNNPSQNNSFNKSFNNKKQNNFQPGYKNNDYHKNRDNNNEFFKKTFRKSFPGTNSWGPQSTKHNEKDGQSECAAEPSQGWDNKNNENNQNNAPAQESEWATSADVVDYSKGTGTGWTENVADFEISDNPPNQWSGIDDH